MVQNNSNISLATNAPQHVAIIMDGNGRWAKGQGEERLFGHNHGVGAVREVVQTAVESGVKWLTIYAFSTENWGRPEDEVDGIMSLISHSILGELETLTNVGIKMNFIGNLDSLPTELQDSIRVAREVVIAAESLRMTLNIALNYSSRWEITEAMREIGTLIQSGDLSPIDVTPELISQHLTTRGIPDPELLIRTSGEERLSNFMLWQLSYTELYFTDVLWPEFGRKQFLSALREYEQRNRRFGQL